MKLADYLSGLLSQYQAPKPGAQTGLLAQQPAQAQAQPAPAEYPTLNPYQGDFTKYGFGGEHAWFNGANGHPYGLPAFTGIQSSQQPITSSSLAQLIQSLFAQYAPSWQQQAWLTGAANGAEGAGPAAAGEPGGFGGMTGGNNDAGIGGEGDGGGMA